ncbi:MAG: hypothetical protein AABZ30_09425, partial [Myxococcota bacterium]
MSLLAGLSDIAAALEGEPLGVWSVGGVVDGVLRVRSAAGEVVLLDAFVWREPGRLDAFVADVRAGRAHLLCLAADDDFERLLAHTGQLDLDCLPLPVHPKRLEITLREAFDALHQRRIVAIARMLASERDVERLLRLILEACR